jgi:hypothetical protein
MTKMARPPLQKLECDRLDATVRQYPVRQYPVRTRPRLSSVNAQGRSRSYLIPRAGMTKQLWKKQWQIRTRRKQSYRLKSRGTSNPRAEEDILDSLALVGITSSSGSNASIDLSYALRSISPTTTKANSTSNEVSTHLRVLLVLSTLVSFIVVVMQCVLLHQVA